MKFKTILVTFSCIFIAVHLLFTLVLALPQGWWPGYLRSVAFAYTGTLFNQNWAMFAPEPPLFHIDLQYKLEGEETWKSTGTRWLEKYQNNRFSPTGKLYQLNQHIGYFLTMDYFAAKEKEEDYGLPVPAYGYGHDLATHFLNSILKESVSHSSNAELRVIHFHPGSPEGWNDSYTDTIYFPDVTIR